MGIPRFFKIPQHKQFHYEPIYYDERKERLEERIRQIEAEHGIKKEGEEPVRSLRKGSFSHYYERRRKVQRYSTTRLIIIIIFLLFVSYYLFFF